MISWQKINLMLRLHKEWVRKILPDVEWLIKDNYKATFVYYSNARAEPLTVSVPAVDTGSDYDINHDEFIGEKAI